MRGYKENLKKFIEYVFEKYGKDNEVQNFQNIYFIQEKNRQKRVEREKKQYGGLKSVRITMNTAILCKTLVLLEKNRELMFTNGHTEHLQALELAYNDLISGEKEGGISYDK